MPELPEVETVRRGLEPVLAGRMIARADVRRPDLRWPFPPGLADAADRRAGQALRRRSKYLLADLDRGETLIVHLGMSGRLLVSGAPLGAFHHAHPAPEKHDHVVLDVEGGARVTFNDARRFGAVDLWPTDDLEAHRLLAGLGPEPLGNGFDAAYLAARLAGPGHAGQGGAARPAGRWRGSATSTSARRCGGPASRRCGWRAT